MATTADISRPYDDWESPPPGRPADAPPDLAALRALLGTQVAGASVVCLAWDPTAQPPRWVAWLLKGTNQGAAWNRTWS